MDRKKEKNKTKIATAQKRLQRLKVLHDLMIVTFLSE